MTSSDDLGIAEKYTAYGCYKVMEAVAHALYNAPGRGEETSPMELMVTKAQPEIRIEQKRRIQPTAPMERMLFLPDYFFFISYFTLISSENVFFFFALQIRSNFYLKKWKNRPNLSCFYCFYQKLIQFGPK